jgi:hypothetical protein
MVDQRGGCRLRGDWRCLFSRTSLTAPANPGTLSAKLALLKAKKWRPRLAFGGVAIAVVNVVIGLWTIVGFTYSRGDRVGFVRKLSERGWACKTYEGTLAMIVQPGDPGKVWEFSVRDKAVADQIAALSGHRVALHYEQHKLVPASCVGETEYFVTGVRQLD